MSITVTEAAAKQISDVISAQDMDEGTVVRMGIAGGGCSGLRYFLGFDNESAVDLDVDACYEQNGIKVVASKKHVLHLNGTTVDYKDGPMGSGFAIDNPNYVNAGCPGCGGH